MATKPQIDDEDDFGGDYPGSGRRAGLINSSFFLSIFKSFLGDVGDKRAFGDLDEEEEDVFGSKKEKKTEENAGATTGMILSLRESLQNCKDSLATCQIELEAAQSEIRKWHSAFQSGPAAHAGTNPEPGLVITYLQNLKSSEDSLKEKLEKAKKREAAFIVTYAKREQEIADLKCENRSKMASSSSSKKKQRPVGPITIHTDGRPCGPHYDALVERISRHVSHCDEFSPSASWPEHKNSGRVEALYRDLTPTFSLPIWDDQQDFAVRFRMWFNDNARHRWSDHKNRSLRRTFERYGSSVPDATAHAPDSIDPETWTALLESYAMNSQEDETGSSKSKKCSESRKTNDLVHRMGRDALCVWKGKFRQQRGRDPTAKEIYAKEYMKSDALDVPEGAQLPPPRSRGMPVSDIARSMAVELDKHYDAALASGSDESSATTQAAYATFGDTTRLGLDRPRGRRPVRRDTHTAQLHEQIETLTQQSATMQQQWDADRARLAELEQWQRQADERQREADERQREFDSFMAEYRARMGGDGNA